MSARGTVHWTIIVRRLGFLSITIMEGGFTLMRLRRFIPKRRTLIFLVMVGRTFSFDLIIIIVGRFSVVDRFLGGEVSHNLQHGKVFIHNRKSSYNNNNQVKGKRSSHHDKKNKRSSFRDKRRNRISVNPPSMIVMERNLGIKVRSSTARNPQGNSIVERIHQSVGLILRVITPEENPRSFEDGKRVIRRCLATAMHACRCASSGAIGDLSPGALAFHRDMLLDIPMQTDITVLTTNRQGMIDRNLLKANAKRIKHDYAVDEKVLKQVSLGFSDKLKPSYTGPYRITTVHTNGTVTIELKPQYPSYQALSCSNMNALCGRVT
ncbi:hypothetical protein IV203_035743 [Nitzschia inconspicua]|uniref:Uncharacterized protein n=1 Tax=Nitzschia inconspicua TaxID=303405 RepID=A0A9K3PXF5_9STRA|nr:hypothetical protein IV203_035743 [Nitzschia inconspicua]